MISESTGIRPRSAPQLVLPRGVEQALAECYCQLTGGRDAEDVRAGVRRPYLLTLRAAARAHALGRSKAQIMAYMHAAVSALDAALPDDTDASLREAVLGEEDAEHALDRLELCLGDHPDRHQLLSVKRAATQQVEATLRVAAVADRALARCG